jgi:hypothetical protein
MESNAEDAQHDDSRAKPSLNGINRPTAGHARVLAL